MSNPSRTILALALCAAGAHAADDPRYAGMLIDSTVSVAGHDFYREFAARWREEGLAARYSVTVLEFPSVRSGTQIAIELRGRRLYSARLPARRTGLEALADDAANTCRTNLVDEEVRELLFRDADLAPAEL